MAAATSSLLAQAIAKEPRAVRELVGALVPVIEARIAGVLWRRGAARSGDIRPEVLELTQQALAALLENEGRLLRSWEQARGVSLESFVGAIADRVAAASIKERGGGAQAFQTEDEAALDRITEGVLARLAQEGEGEGTGEGAGAGVRRVRVNDGAFAQMDGAWSSGSVRPPEEVLDEWLRAPELTTAEHERFQLLRIEATARETALLAKRASELISTVSHELRTPLNVILILAKLLAENAGSNLSEKQIEHAATIHSTCYDLLLLINDTLDLSKIKSGAPGVTIDDVVLAGVGEAMERRFRELFRQKGIELKIRIAEGAPRVIQTDRRKLHQALTNLLANALKFTERGRVDLTMKAARARDLPDGVELDPPGEAVAFVVADTGIGIEPDQQAVIFEPYRQAREGGLRAQGGTGLGLSISREIARTLGGDVTVSSAPGEGSVFTLYLPPAPASEEESAAPDEGRSLGSAVPGLWFATLRDGDEGGPISGQDVASARGPESGPDPILAGRKVLIIDDDVRDIFVLTSFLERHKVTVVHAESGRKGLEILKSTPDIDAVMVDAAMPDNDGPVTIREARAMKRRGELPILALTTGAGRGEREACVEAGASALTSKPIERVELLSLLHRAFEGPPRA